MKWTFASMACLFGLLAIWPLFGSDYEMDLAVRVMILALFALSLEWLVGGAGLVCFGQAAFFGLGAYAAVWLAPADGSAALLPVGWLGALLIAGGYALAVGALALRTRGVYFIMVTLAFAQMAYYVVHDTPLGGGSDGVYLYVKPAWGDRFTLDDPVHFYAFTWLSLLAGFALLVVLRRAQFGRALDGLRVNEQRMRAAGFSPYPYQLAAFTLAGMLAGWAGFLYAVKDGYVNPELLSWHQSGAVLIMVILGGLGHLRGAIVGALAFTLLQEFFRSEAVFGDFARHWHLGLGLSIIAVVALLPRGLMGLPQLLRQRLGGGSVGPLGGTVPGMARRATVPPAPGTGGQP